MGKQEFAGGGFVGKVGKFVGQTFKGTFVLRAYTKPIDPKTEKQQKARADFAFVSRQASLSMNLSKGRGGFDLTKYTDQVWRLKQTLSEFYANGMDTWVPPYFLDGTEEPFTVTGCPISYNPTRSLDVTVQVSPMPTGLDYWTCNLGIWYNGQWNEYVSTLTQVRNGGWRFGFTPVPAFGRGAILYPLAFDPTNVDPNQVIPHVKVFRVEY